MNYPFNNSRLDLLQTQHLRACSGSPVDEVLLLQILHGGGDLRGHVEQHHGIDLLMITVTQVIQQVSVGHELGDDVKRRFPCADT